MLLVFLCPPVAARFPMWSILRRKSRPGKSCSVYGHKLEQLDTCGVKICTTSIIATVLALPADTLHGQVAARSRLKNFAMIYFIHSLVLLNVFFNLFYISLHRERCIYKCQVLLSTFLPRFIRAVSY